MFVKFEVMSVIDVCCFSTDFIINSDTEVDEFEVFFAAIRRFDTTGAEEFNSHCERNFHGLLVKDTSIDYHSAPWTNYISGDLEYMIIPIEPMRLKSRNDMADKRSPRRCNAC